MITALSARDVEEILPRPSAAVERLATTVMRVVTGQWKRHIKETFQGETLRIVSTRKLRIAAIMYARGCYSMVVLGRGAPSRLRLVARLSRYLPLSPGFVARLGSFTFSALPSALPKRLNRQIVLVGVLMALFDEIVDEYALQGRRPEEVFDNPALRALVLALRKGETPWQSEYWNSVLMPAKWKFAREEQLAVAGVADAESMGHRGAGIDAAIKSMWYVIGPYVDGGACGKAGDCTSSAFAQRWMADGTQLVQMMDDWIDCDLDATVRPTPVTQGQWTLSDIKAQYRKTREGLKAVLYEQGIYNEAVHEVVHSLHAEYLRRALRAMQYVRD